MAQLNATLEQRVTERTAELARANDRLQADAAEMGLLQDEIVAVGERERRRIGQDLHDGLCQLLTGVRCKTDVLADRLAGRSPAEARGARAIARLLARAIEESRGLAHGLEPVERVPEGLMAALRRLAESTQSLFQVTCWCQIRGPVLVDDHRVATDLFRIAQEAVSNAIKHGKAETIRLHLARIKGRLVLTVGSNGRTFPVRPRSGGLGLKTMNYRATRIGAALTLRPGPRGGAIVRCSLPSEKLPSP